MPGVRRRIGWVVLAVVIGVSRPGLAETDTVRILRPVDLATLPLLIAETDRIAVPALKTSGPALLLQMAAAQEWGPENYAKLDPMMVARSDEAATEAVESGRGDLASHFSRSPYSDDELADPKIRRIMDSFYIPGPHTH